MFISRQLRTRRIKRKLALSIAAIIVTGVALFAVLRVQAGIAVWTPPTIQIISRSAADSTGRATCVVVDNKVYCWGDTNTYGQLGTGDNTTTSLTPRQVYDPNNVLFGKQITGLALANTGTVCVVASNVPYCWGRGNYGALGDNTTSDRYYPSAVTTSGVLAGKTITDITAGDGHVCVVASGAAYCWGTNGSGRLGDGTNTQRNTPVAVSTSGVLSGKTVTSISAGTASTCAVATGAAYCWGYDTEGELGNDSSYASSTTPVAVDITGPLSGKTIKSVTSGLNHNCALTTDGIVACWGYNNLSQLGDNTTTTAPVPVAVYTAGALSGKTVATVRAGDARTCALDTSSKAYCWGTGPVGDGTSGTKAVPTAVTSTGVLNGMNITQVAANVAGFCFLNDQNRLYCNSGSANGSLGNNTTSNSYPVVQVLFNATFNAPNYRLYANANSATPGTPLASINGSATLSSTGQAFRVRMGVKTSPQMGAVVGAGDSACSISDGKAYCWGNGAEGEMGDGTTNNINDTPRPVDMTGVLAGKTVLQLAAGLYHVCALASDKQVYCWGDDSSGQLGNNSTTQSNVPVAVTTSGVLSGKTIVSISAADYETCAVASDGNAYCWGANGQGQLGNNSTTQSNVPVAVTTSGVLSGKTILSISVGDSHTCVIASDNQAYCWGNGGNGRLGNNSATNSSVPVAVSTSGAFSGKTVRSIAAGGAHTCAIASDGLAYCWGWNYHKQIGSDTGGSDRLVPTAVDTSGVLSGKTILAVATGHEYGYETCAIASDGNAYCWGQNDIGQLGNGTTATNSLPVAVTTSGVLSGKSLKSIVVGNAWSCAVASDAKPYCWGQNWRGQLGNGSSTGSEIAPVATIVDDIIPGASVPASANTYKLQFAQKTLSTCSVQTGFADVTASSAIAFNTNAGVTSGASITATANDPVPTTDSVPQTYISASGTFTNTSTITGGKTGLWDFSLKDNSGLYDTSYCLRMTYGDGTNLEGAVQYPEVKTVGRSGAANSAYRFYQNANSLTPGTALTTANTAATLSSYGQAFRVRIGVSTNQQPALQGKTILSSSSGEWHNCVIASDNKVYCLGDNSIGQLGDGTTTNSLGAVAVDTSGVLSGKTITRVSAGLKHTCVLTSEGKVYCWGYNNNGQLGNGTYTDSLTPVAVDTSGELAGKTVTKITAGMFTTCALTSEGRVYCWGDDTRGELGNNYTTSSPTPVAVVTTGVLSGKTVTNISVTEATACALTSDGNVYCWGEGASGILGDGNTSSHYSAVPTAIVMTGVLSGKTISEMSAGGAHVCVLASDNKPYCWGYNAYGQLGNNSTTNSGSPVAVTTSGVLSGKTLHGIESGYEGSCVLDASNNAYCWGMGTHGELGNSASSNSSVPVAVTMTGVLSGKTITALDGGFGDEVTGEYINCARTSDGGLYCWGSDADGQLGNSSTTNSNVAVTFSTATYSSKADITAGTNAYKLQFAQKTLSTCSVQTGFADVTTSSAIAFNTNASATHGAAITTNANDPVATSSSVAESYISAVGSFTNPTTIPAGKSGIWDFSLKDNSGLNDTSYCLKIVYSDGAAMTDTTYAEVKTVPKIDANLSAYRFYQNADSLTPGTALGATNTATNLVAPNQAFRLRAGVKSSPKLTGITAGSDSTCAINYAGNAYCWGDNVYGTLGIGMTGGQYDNSDTPLAVVTTGVLSGKTVLSITAGGGHTCAVASDHLAYCWGLNDHGQLGNNSTTNANAPVAVDTSGVLSGKTILSISAGDGYTCAIASDNNAYCWGYNNNGQLGNNSTTESHVPVAVSTSGVLLGKTVTSVVAGVEHVCVIASDNNAYCWGLGIYGQFGNGGNTSSSVPVAISTTGVLSGKTILSLAIGPLQTCVVASDNKAYCTGLNYYGALGDGTNIDSNTMVAVSTTGVLSGKTILSMDGGSIYSQGFCALASDNNAYCWGQGDNAQLGNGGTANSNVPVAVSTSGVLAGKTIASIAVGSGYGCIIASDYQPYCWGSNWVGQLGNGAGGVAYSAAVVASVVDGHIPGVDVTAAANPYKLQYAAKSVSVCSAQTTGFADVTTTSAIAFNTNASATHGSTITTNANDPVATANSVAESYISAVGSFTNPTAINGGKIGIWDFSLKDNSGLYSTSYCLRIVYADGSTMASTMTPELRTTTGTLSVGFVDGADAPLSNPTINFVGTNVMTSWQAAYGVLGTSTQKLRIYNDLTTNGWNVSIAATNGPTALWDRTDHLAKYDFNDIAGYSDGSDTDTLAGIMAVAPDSSTITSSCSTTGLTRGTGSYFNEGTTNSITLLSASSTAAMGCAFDLTNIGLSQAIPAAQPSGTYTLDMTITVVAL